MSRKAASRILVLLCGMVGGCDANRALHLQLNADVVRPPLSAVVFFADGMDRKRFDGLLADGLLPNIERRFVQGGVRVRHAVVSLPPITYPNSVSLLTGQFPGHHGILGNVWFDRHSLECRDYIRASTYRTVDEHFQAPTIYEILADQFTVSVQFHTRRGVSQTIDNVLLTGVHWVTHKFNKVDRNVGAEIETVAKFANSRRRWPTLITNYSPGLDEVGHRYGPDSDRYQHAMVTIDKQVGRVTDALEREGLLRQSYLVLLTDHGHVPTAHDRVYDLVGWLRNVCGHKVHEGPIDKRDFNARLRFLEKYSVVAINGAYRRLVIHLRGPGGWDQPATSEQIDGVIHPSGTAIYDLPGVDLVCKRSGEGRVRVFSGRGVFDVERFDQQYRIVDYASDPLGYRDNNDLSSFIDSGWHSSREWLAATAASGYPDFVPQIVEMFDTHRAGDIVVFSATDWAFSERERGGHGSCVAADMQVPLFFAGPDLPAGGQIDCARNVDVMPTLLELLNMHDRLAQVPGIDGVSIAGQLRGARGRQIQSAIQAQTYPNVAPARQSLGQWTSLR